MNKPEIALEKVGCSTCGSTMPSSKCRGSLGYLITEVQVMEIVHCLNEGAEWIESDYPQSYQKYAQRIRAAIKILVK